MPANFELPFDAMQTKWESSMRTYFQQKYDRPPEAPASGEI